MPRPEKVQAVAEIKEQFEGARAVFVTEYRGIAVKDMGDLRRRLRDSGADYKVVKMTLARLAADDLGIEGIEDELSGPTALAFANDDPVATAKALSDFARDNANLVIKLGLLADKLLRPEDVSKLAEIEPRDVLLAKVAGAAKAPLVAVAGMLSSFNRNAAGLFSALLEKKESEPVSAETPVADEAAVPPDTASTESTDDADSPDEAEETDAGVEADPEATAQDDESTDDDSTEESSDQAEEE